MQNKIAMILLTVGLFFIGYASVQLKFAQQSEKAALIQAKEILEKQQKTKSPQPELSFQNGQTIGILQIPIIHKELPLWKGPMTML